MMKHTLKISSLFLSAILMAACGGGGGSSYSQNGNMPPPTPLPPADKITNPFNISQVVLDKSVSGEEEYITIVLTDDKGEAVEIYRNAWWTLTTHVTNDPSKNRVVQVNPSLNKKEYNSATMETTVIKGDSSSLFGMSKEDQYGERDTWYAYAGGAATDINNLPLENVTYNGLAYAVADRSEDYYTIDFQHNQEQNIQYGTARIDVDFGENSVTGDLIFNSNFIEDIAVTGKIEGAQFKGNASTSTESAPMVGQFNGTNAAEIVGAFNSESPNGMAGAFGAGRE